MLSWINSGQTCLFNSVSSSGRPLNCPYNSLYTDFIIDPHRMTLFLTVPCQDWPNSLIEYIFIQFTLQYIRCKCDEWTKVRKDKNYKSWTFLKRSCPVLFLIILIRTEMELKIKLTATVHKNFFNRSIQGHHLLIYGLPYFSILRLPNSHKTCFSRFINYIIFLNSSLLE